MTANSTRIELAGAPKDLFSHMALWGLVAICEDAGLLGVRGFWTDEARSVPILQVGAEENEVAEAVLDHARLRAERTSWLWEEFTVHSLPKAPSVAAMAPRTATPTTNEEWQRLDADVERIAGQLPSVLDERLLLGLGHRSWWVFEGKGMRSDRGCSLWEMRTRNKGTDMVRDRLRPLAVEVATWAPAQIMDGLTGERTDDPVGKNAADSRSATGFRLPGPVDNARAWCAIWALSLLPVTPTLHGGGHSPAVAQRNTVNGSPLHHLLMVMPSRPMPLARLARLLTSEQIKTAASDAPTGDTVTDAQRAAARRSARSWLRDRGASMVLRFPVQYVGSQSAPERQALAGQAVVS